MDLPRFGIVDMGSNAIRMMIAEVHGGTTALLENHRLPLRLGRDVFYTGQVPESSISAVVDAFRRFRATCERHGVQHVRAVATAAVREARNRDLLIDRIREAVGVDIEVISGTQEAYLLVQAVQTRIDVGTGRSLLVDVGGGSVEIVLIEDGHVTGADSYRLGALRMLAVLGESGSNGEPFVDLLLRHLHGLESRIADRFGAGRVDRYVAVGGNIESLADLLKEQRGDRRTEGVESHPLAQLREETMALAKLTYDERMARRGLKPDRADTIVPAGVVYTRIAEIAGADRVLVPRIGIKDGLLAELAAGHYREFAADEHVETVLSACRALARKFHAEPGHCEAVLTLARQLFDQTAQLHGLDARARVLLEAAAILHDVGVGINNDGHHKHSQYLILASDIVGLSDDEKRMVALLARYHRKAPPAREHDDFATLRRRDRTAVERLTALLRLADALDRQHSNVVRGVTVRIHDDAMDIRPILVPGQDTRLTLERRAVEEKGAMFAQLFGKQPRLLPP